MFSSIAALVFLGFALAWTALNKSGIPAFDWYMSLIFIGIAVIAFWTRPRRKLCPPFPAWMTWTIRGLMVYIVFQAIPLPVGLISVISPARAELTRAIPQIVGPVTATPISVDPAAHILWLTTIVGCTVAFFLVRDLTFRFQSKLFLAILPLLLVAGFEALLGLLQVAGGAEQAIGSYNSRDHYCCILEMTLPVAIAFGLLFFGRRNQGASLWPIVSAIGCWLTAALLMLGILFSLSRAGWVDALASLVLLTILLLFPKISSNTLRLGTLAGLLVVASIIFIVVSPGAMLTRLVGSLTPDAEGRIYIWKELMPLLAQYRWFGSGLMGFDPIFLKYQAVMTWERVDFAHNDFLQYFIELGIIGFLPLMVSLGTIIYPIAKGSWFSRSERKLLLIGCLAGMFALFVHSLVDFNLYVPANMFAFAWVLGFGSAVAVIATPADHSTPMDEVTD